CSLFFSLRDRFLFFALARFIVGQAKERGDRLPHPRRPVLFLELRLAFHRKAGKWNRLEPGARDRLARHLAFAVGAEIDPLQGLIDLVKGVLFLRQKAERKITIVSVAP